MNWWFPALKQKFGGWCLSLLFSNIFSIYFLFVVYCNLLISVFLGNRVVSEKKANESSVTSVLHYNFIPPPHILGSQCKPEDGSGQIRSHPSARTLNQTSKICDGMYTAESQRRKPWASDSWHSASNGIQSCSFSERPARWKKFVPKLLGSSQDTKLMMAFILGKYLSTEGVVSCNKTPFQKSMFFKIWIPSFFFNSVECVFWCFQELRMLLIC